MSRTLRKPEARPGLMDIVPYQAGKAPELKDGRPVYKLSSNESGLGASPAAMAAFREASASLEVYPDGASSRLKAAIAKTHDLPEANIWVGAGSDEVISGLARGFAGEGTSIVQTRHGFSYYWLAARAAGAEPLYAGERELHADVDAILATVREDTRVVYLANPNNPTGTVIPPSEVRRLREELPEGVILAIDGAYAEYMAGETVAGEPYTDGSELVAEAIEAGRDDTVMMRTFSKIYGLGGLRVGWCYAPESVIGVLDRVRSPFNVNAPALAAAEAALGDQAFVDRNREHNRQERARVAQRVAGLGLGVMPSAANFLLLKMPGADDAAKERTADAFFAYLAEEGIMVRAQKGAWLPTYLRVSIGSTEANDAFLAAAESFFANR